MLRDKRPVHASELPEYMGTDALCVYAWTIGGALERLLAKHGGARTPAATDTLCGLLLEHGRPQAIQYARQAWRRLAE